VEFIRGPIRWNKRREVTILEGAILVGVFVLLVGPLSVFFGADSRL
jgi:hypothetical protein